MSKKVITLQGKKIELNKQFQSILDLLEHTKKHVFISGKAGTGKSTLLQYWREISDKNIVVLAPTGVAALTIGGQTIHSFCEFKPDITIEKIRPLEKGEKKSLCSKIDAIVIDEISMVRADLLDCVDRFLQLNGPQRYQPFGGVQMIFIGDLYQLPPVVKQDQEILFRTTYKSPYFFSAKVFQNNDQQLLQAFDVPTFERVELEKIYRQSDKKFIEILQGIRTNAVGDHHLPVLNERWDSFFLPSPDEFWVTLTTTNAAAAAVNQAHVDQLKGEVFTYEARMSGEVSKEYFPTEEVFSFKIGAQVMFLQNDRNQRWVNGTIGHVLGVGKDEETKADVLSVQLEDKTVVKVLPYTWEVFDWKFDTEKKELISETTGTFTQYPLRLAWAITIHKSQGKTFDRVIIDLGRGTFVSGQLYVALSRCRTLQGIVLTRDVRLQDVRMDERIVRFMRGEEIGELPAIIEPLADQNVINLIREAIVAGRKISFGYQTNSEKKTTRTILPATVGELVYNGKSYQGVEGECQWLRETRSFRLDRICDIRIL